MATLGRVAADLNEERGPDVTLEVRVPAAWIANGASLEIDLPRLLPCARCEGGGCDACGRAGAFRSDQLAENAPLQVQLPPRVDDTGEPCDLQLRLPGAGVRVDGQSAGHLLLRLRCDSVPSEGVRRIAVASARRLPWPLLAVVLVAILLWWLSR